MPIALYVAQVGTLPAGSTLDYAGDLIARLNDRLEAWPDPLPEPLPNPPVGETLEEVRWMGTDWRVRFRFWEDIASTHGGYAPIYQIPETQVKFYWVLSTAAKLKALHDYLYGINVALGALAVVDPDAAHEFLPRAVRDAFEWTVQEALDRRDRMAIWLTNQGYDASAVSAATNEHDLVAGIVSALGFEMRQLWRTMIA